MISTARPSPVNAVPAMPRDDIASRAVPFDYSFRFLLDGKPRSVLRTTLTISVEASFTAVSIGYGVVPEVSPVIFGPSPPPPIILARPLAPPPPGLRIRDIRLGDLLDALETALPSTPDVPKDTPALEAALRNGIKLNADFAALALQGNGNAVLDPASLSKLFQVVSPPASDVQFLYTLLDEGSGREFQSDPLLNIAGLGSPDGRRPFRYFAQPVTFAPRATIRMEITQLTDFRGELHVSLHGYKVLGPAGAPATPRDRPQRHWGR
jgi:hypothetical protein